MPGLKGDDTEKNRSVQSQRADIVKNAYKQNCLWWFHREITLTGSGIRELGLQLEVMYKEA